MDKASSDTINSRSNHSKTSHEHYNEGEEDDDQISINGLEYDDEEDIET